MYLRHGDLPGNTKNRPAQIFLVLVMLCMECRTTLGQSVPDKSLEQVMCGPNSLQMLMAAVGVYANVDDFTPLIGSRVKGMSLKEIKEAASQLNFPVEVRQSTLRELTAGSCMPYIALLAPPSLQTGHYVVVTNADDHSVSFLDGTTRQPNACSAKHFGLVFTGYVVLPIRSHRWARDYNLLMIIFTAGIIGGLWRGLRWTASKRRTKNTPSCSPSLRSIAIFASVFVLATADSVLATTPSKAPEVTDAWRRPDQDGLNSLYLHLRCRGYDRSYGEFRKLAVANHAANDARSLCALAAEAGYSIELRKISRKDLYASERPLVTFQEPYGVGNGAFVLFCRQRLGQVELIEGGAFRWLEVPSDQFERMWTGYALVPAVRIDFASVVFRCFCGLLIVVVLYQIISRVYSHTGRSSSGSINLSLGAQNV